MKVICFAAVAVATSAAVACANTKPQLPGPDASPRELTRYLAEAVPSDITEPMSTIGQRLLSTTFAARLKRAAKVQRWTNDPDYAFASNIITGTMDITDSRYSVTERSPTAITVHFTDEAKVQYESTFEFVREAGEWKLADIAYKNGDRLSKSLDEVGSVKLPGRPEITTEYDVDLAKGMLNGESGTTLEHNGSDVLLFQRAGLILFERPKAAIAGTVKPKTLLFTGTFSHGRVEGIAYTFKKGCNPAPYEVSGTYRLQGFGGSNEITLSGAAPVADPKSCAIVGYSTTASNANLHFSFANGDL